MRKFLYSIPVFFVALVIGLLIAPRLKIPAPQTESIRQVVEELPSALENTTAVAEADPYFAEFTNLSSFDFCGGFEPPGQMIDVLESGSKYRKSEVIAKTGETWLTLFKQNGEYELKKTRVKVKQLRTISYVGDENDAALSFDKKGTAIFAVKGIPKLKPGTVTTLYHAPTFDEISRRNLDINNMGENYKRDFELNGKWYTLRVADGLTDDGVKARVLVLEHDGSHQILRRIHHDEYMPIGRLLWAGDLDRDGKLDLYFDEFNEKGYFSVELLLSSEAEPNELVRPAARFFVAGC